jgi:hypothetical protein
MRHIRISIRPRRELRLLILLRRAIVGKSPEPQWHPRVALNSSGNDHIAPARTHESICQKDCVQSADALTIKCQASDPLRKPRVKSCYARRVSSSTKRIRSNQLVHLVDLYTRIVQCSANDWCCDVFNR